MMALNQFTHIHKHRYRLLAAWLDGRSALWIDGWMQGCVDDSIIITCFAFDMASTRLLWSSVVVVVVRERYCRF